MSDAAIVMTVGCVIGLVGIACLGIALHNCSISIRYLELARDHLDEAREIVNRGPR